MFLMLVDIFPKLRRIYLREVSWKCRRNSVSTRKYVDSCSPDVGWSFDRCWVYWTIFIFSCTMQAYFRRSRSKKEWLSDILQVFHFLVVIGFLWAGLVEFIRNPPFFDAYGDAATRNSLPKGLFEVSIRSIGIYFFKYSLNTLQTSCYYQYLLI